MEPGNIIHARKPLKLSLSVRRADIHSSTRNLFSVRQGWIEVRIHSFRLSNLLAHDKFDARYHGTDNKIVKTKNILAFKGQNCISLI